MTGAVTAVLLVAAVVVLVWGDLSALVPSGALGWLVVLGVAAAAVGWTALVRRFVRAPGAAAAVAVVPLVAVLAWAIYPTVVDREVDEGLLDGVAVAEPMSDETPDSGGAAATTPVQVASGELQGADGHSATGTAAVYEAGATTFVRLEDIETDGAPDVRVLLVPQPGQEGPDGGLDLGALKGNVGSSNYEVPTGTDVSAYRSVLLWCRAFSTPIGVATLTS
ncbi:MAG TPA: DM13 domain-containing protein [Mycobacteriales bacterium]|nr:DM13 domain-containing protein [Mycobacteriales bacterium]